MRRRPEGFNLAFLDIMACGLGAVVLVLVLLTTSSPLVQSSSAPLDLTALQQEIDSIQEAIEKSKSELNELNVTSQEKQQNAEEKLAKIKALQRIIAQQQSQQRSLQRKVTSASAELKTKQASVVPEKVVQTQSSYQQDFLIGLEVTGRNIVILVDKSASMTARDLLSITINKTKSASQRAKTKKWLRTKAIVRWLLARLPKGSKVKVIAFNTNASDLSTQWVSASDGAGLSNLIRAVERLDPKDGTDLEAAAQTALSKRPDAVYVITDGLPTQGKRSNSLVPSGGCGGPLTKTTVSGECRATLFNDVEKLTAKYTGVISTILLPLEGDPQAAPLFTRWSLANKGTLLSPPGDWP